MEETDWECEVLRYKETEVVPSRSEVCLSLVVTSRLGRL